MDGTASDIDFGDWLVQQGIVSIDEYREKQKEAKDLMNAKKKEHSL